MLSVDHDMPFPSEIMVFHSNAEFVRMLHLAEVRFLIIGGIATWFHGCRDRDDVKDLDLIVEPTKETGERIIQILQSQGWTTQEPPEKFEVANLQIPVKGSLMMYDLDLVTPPADLIFEEMWERSIESVLGRTPVRVVSREDLIVLKQPRKEARVRDQVDLRKLQAG